MNIHEKIIAAMEASWLIRDLDELFETSLSFLLQLPYVHHVAIALFDESDNLVPVATAENERHGDQKTQKISAQSYLLNAYVRHSIRRRITMPEYRRAFYYPLLKHDGLLGLLIIRFTGRIHNEIALLENLHFFSHHLAGKVREIIKEQEIRAVTEELDHVRRHSTEILQQVTALSKELYAITAISTKINQSMDLQKSLRKSVAKVKEVFDPKGVLIYRRTILKNAWELSHCDMAKGLFSDLEHKEIEAFFLEEIAQTSKPLLKFESSDFFKPGLKNGVKSTSATIIGVPMKSKVRIHGVLLLFLEPGRSFNPDNLRLLSGMGNIMGMAVENIDLFHKAEVKKRESAFLVDSIAKFNEKLDLERTLKSVAEKGAQLVGESSCIYLFSETRYPMIQVACENPKGTPRPKAHSMDKIEPRELRSLYQSMKSEKKAILVRDIGKSRRIPKETKIFFKTEDIRSLIMMPLRFRGKTLGLVVLGRLRKKRPFDRHDLALCKALGSAAAVAIQNSWTYAQSLEMSGLLERKVREKSTLIQQLHDKQTSRFETRDDITFWVNNQNEFVFVNRAMETLTGLSRETLCGGHILATDVVFEEDRSRIKDRFMSVLMGEAPFLTDLEYRHLNWKGEDHIVSLTIYPAKKISGKIIGIEGIGRNISETKMLEAELEKNKNLALLGEFSGAVAHQIRNPLSNILMSINLLQKFLPIDGNGRLIETKQAAPGKPGLLNEQYLSELFGNLRDSVNNLNRVVTEMLQYTRTLKLSLSVQQIDLVIDETLNRLRNHIKDKDIIVQKRFDSNLPPIPFDAVLMSQVFQNVIQNGIEAMQEGGTLEVFSGLSEQKEDFLKIAVKDSGPGLAPSETGKIFHPMYTTKVSGTGLGLSLSHRIIEAHKGTMWAANNSEKGMTVHILLPTNTHEKTPMPKGGPRDASYSRSG